MKKFYLIANLIFVTSVFAQNANVSLSNLSNNNGYSSYNSSSKTVSGIFFEILSQGNNSNNLLDDFETALYLLTCDAGGNATSSTPIIIKTYNISGMYQMSSVDYSNESVDLSQVNGLNDGMYRLGVWVNSNTGIPQPPDDPSDNAALIRSSAGTAAGSVINYSSSGSSTGLAELGANKPVSVYPNPVSDQVTFSNARSSVITICDVSGRVIESIAVTGENINLDISSYKAGVYFYQIKGPDEIISGKLVKK